MTRARHTLTLARLEQGNPFIDQMPESAAVLRRPVSQWLPPPPGLKYRYLIPSLQDVVLSHAGWQKPSAPIHHHLAALRTGDLLQLAQDEKGYLLLNAAGQPVGRLSKKFAAPPGLSCLSARVHAVLTWRKSDSAPEYQDRCQSERWEVVLPELVFGPVASS